MRWIIVSNRLPFRKNEAGELTRSSGGLVTALSGVQTDAEQLWVGIAPEGIDEAAWQGMPLDYQKSYQPVFVDENTYDAYYNGIANDVFWPLFHYEGSMIKFSLDNWLAYQRVNYEIAKVVSDHATHDDVIWIHDFHLFLLPQMLKEMGVSCRIGFFLHIPFPSFEIFRTLPWREEILHNVIFPGLIYSMVFVLWMFWVYRFNKTKS